MDIKMTHVKKLAIYIHDAPGYAYSFLSSGSTYMRSGSMNINELEDLQLRIRFVNDFEKVSCFNENHF